MSAEEEVREHEEEEEATTTTTEVEEETTVTETSSEQNLELKTTPFDPRFPQTNQAKHCYTRYNEFHKCQAENGEGAEECEPLAKFYRAICPTEWTEKWNEEREEGTWAGRY